MHATNQLYVYAITLWNMEKSPKDVSNYFNKIAKKFIFQLEKCPTSETPHYQCYVNLKTKKRQHEMCKMFNSEGFTGADIKPASENGKETLKNYCMKETTRMDGPWADKPIYLGRDLIKQLRPWQQSIVNLLD